jgi:hypothetical protein
MRRLKVFLAILMTVAPLYISAPSAAAFWNPFQQACNPAFTTDNHVCNASADQIKSSENPISGPHGIIQEATNVFALITIVGGMVVMGYAAFVFVTAGGARSGDNASRARNARTSIVSALTGIAIAALAWTIITFVNTRIIH